MAEECRYYYYDSGYCCRIKRETEGSSSVDSDTVHRYCWGYHYDDCPRYRKAEYGEYSGYDFKRDSSNDSAAGSSGDSSWCFLTSACTAARGLPDDCRELTALRAFRDGYMQTLPEGKRDIQEYYRCAPVIVAAIDSLPDAKMIWERVYSELVLPCVEMIDSGRYHEAYTAYKSYTKSLQEAYSS